MDSWRKIQQMDSHSPRVWLGFLVRQIQKILSFCWDYCRIPVDEDVAIEEDSFPDEHIFLISTYDPSYGDILIYLQTLKYPASFSWEEWCKLCLHAMNYLIIGDTLYLRRVDFILCRCLTHEEAEVFLNDSHSEACGGHLSRLATTQKILCVDYFWPTIFKDCVEAMKHCHPCHIYTRNMWSLL